MPGLRWLLAWSLIWVAASPALAQVYSPLVLRQGQVDPTDLHRLARGIFLQAGANTPREKAEAIWRFFLTDGRFVKPGFWYHIAGWAYEEPRGEVLDPLKLLNSYGFGLCYHMAPLLAAVFDAGGFPDARVWFLTGHTVAEVFYDGAYHYYDSDMMGYSTLGNGPPARSVVASVNQIERDGSVISGKLVSARQVNPALVDYPWYPADVREGAIGDLTALFTTTSDNWLYAPRRYPQGHSMSFVLRPGEKIVRFFRPEEEGLYYLPYKFTGGKWSEFPQAVAEYAIRTEDGPRSQKDARSWATGRIEYEPDLPALPPAQVTIEMPSPYVIIDASAEMEARLGPDAALVAETSVDDGQTWQLASRLAGPHFGIWKVEAATMTKSEHGRRTAVSGSYGYLLRLTSTGAAGLSHVKIVTRFELNPRTLPELQPGENWLVYSAGPMERFTALHVSLAEDAQYVDEAGQGFVLPKDGGEAELVFRIASRDGEPLSSFRAGGRFLDIRDSLAPDKLTAEVRKTSHAPSRDADPYATLKWSESPAGPFKSLWTYAEPKWRDGQAVDRMLRWPEVDRTVSSLPAGTKAVWIRYRLRGMALDDVRLSYMQAGKGRSPLEISHVWREGGRRRQHTETIAAGRRSASYEIRTAGTEPLQNEALILTCPRNR